MYKEGEYIVYGLNGVCLIDSITTLLFYQLLKKMLTKKNNMC